MQEFNLQDSVKGIWDKLEGWLDTIILGLPNFLLAVVVFIIFVFLAKYVGKIFDKIFARSIKQDSIRQMATKVIKAIVILIGFFIALGLLNLDTVLTSVLGAAGVVGLAIGLALQGTLNNTFSGLILSFLPELQIGDWVETNGYAGSVMEINLRNIVIKQSDNNYVIIPNGKIIEEPFKNYSRTARSRVFVNCGVGYSSDLEIVRDLTIKTIEDIFPQRGNEEVELMFQEFGDSSINYVLRFWTDVTKNRDILIAQNTAIIAIKKAYDAKGINIPFPIRTIDFTNKLSVNKD
ncbi:mechanosensitive ion channel family protein [Christiangramia sp. OXR-203]|jgi:small conductance mechanosensitive channel|uniref:mechanosensitive ion channel family protein n=1 Tax=Christiangramia sp. OXR-203 TaxID=3100176 RepID=UPI002AC8B6F8|nr:mechanosensitive ion channel family protein [Christiangramia sp. OXR-203]WPY99692.1 mechanosensitive ion channel family protein [Christiangramia sp. OXR-203]